MEAGYPYTEDPNGFMQEGFCTYDLTIKDGKRCGIGKAYLNEALKRKNVDIFTQSQVQKIILEDKVARGIEVTKKEKKKKLQCKDVLIIVAHNSPKLLQLSGRRCKGSSTSIFK